MTVIDPASHFDRARAEGYDRRVRHLIPGYEAVQGLALSLLESSLGAESSVLVAGAGTGSEAVSFASRNPGWKVTGFDPAAEMLKIAGAKVREEGLEDRVSLVEGFAGAVEERPLFDAATSMLVMHFLPDDGSKDEFLSGISKRLKPGARIVLTDLEGDTASPAFKTLEKAWRRQLLSVVKDPEAVEETFENLRTNVKFVPEKRIREILENAGFPAAVKFFQGFLTGGYTAVKT
ncbi:MAG: class I SAM-dependent methyltransferase [Thermodesulfobacteriota bacterium]